MYQTTFVVSGRGHFPFDMLRYDGCHPVSSDDAYSMSVCDSRDTAVHAIKLCMVSRFKTNSLPTVARWQSFGWTVANIETTKL